MLEHFVVGQVFTFLMIFSRILGGIIVLPGFGESYVPVRIRLSFALMLALMLTPVLIKVIPPMPASPFSLALLLISELIIGLFIGLICNILISVTNTAGMIISFQAGISSDVIYDVTQSSQGSVIGNFLGIVTLVVLFMLNFHHLMLRGITESYGVFVPGHFPPLHDFLETIARTISQTFSVALQISAPVVVATGLLFLGSGIIARLMPTIQVFFLIVPPQLLLGLFIFMTSFSTIMLWYIEFYKDQLTGFMSYLK
jgi:flagellar biosynthetic protein FliR